MKQVKTEGRCTVRCDLNFNTGGLQLAWRPRPAGNHHANEY